MSPWLLKTTRGCIISVDTQQWTCFMSPLCYPHFLSSSLIFGKLVHLSGVLYMSMWIKIEQMQQYADIYLLQSYSTYFGCHSTHHQEYKNCTPSLRVQLHLLDFYSHWITMHGTTSLKFTVWVLTLLHAYICNFFLSNPWKLRCSITFLLNNSCDVITKYNSEDWSLKTVH